MPKLTRTFPYIKKKKHKDGPIMDGSTSSNEPDAHPVLSPQANSTITNSVIAARGNIAMNNVAGNLTISNEDTPTMVHLKTLLNPISAAYDSYEAGQRSKCFENTRVELLSNIEKWFTGNGNQPPIYVLDGIAGIGKSTVAQTVAERAAGLRRLGASFFFTRNEVERMIAKHFFPTVAYHLACFNEAFADQITEAVKQKPDAAQKGLLQQFQLLILDPLQSQLVQEEHPVLIVIDALDECEDEDAKSLLILLAKYIHHLPRLRILITARPERHIRDILEEDRNHELFHLHDIDDAIVHSDIRLYLSFTLSPEQVKKAFPRRQPPWQPSAKDMDMLCGVAGKLFIIASTAAKFILDDKSSGPDEQLACILDGVSPHDFSGSDETDVMDKFYIQIIRAAAPAKLTKSWTDRYQTVVGAIIVLQTPLPCRSLAQLLDLNATSIEEAFLRLHSLVAPAGSGDDLTFRVHHKSFPDFITNELRIKRSMSHSKTDISDLVPSLLIDAKEHHLRLAKACFRAMDDKFKSDDNLKSKRNIANLSPEEWYKDKVDVPRLTQQLVSDELAYAVTHWSSHLHAAGSIAHGAESDLMNWATKYILAWLEVMCILGNIEKTYEMLENTLATIGTHVKSWPQKSALRELLSDASRFVLQSGETIKLSPMHVYWSGLPFIPSRSAISVTYQEAIVTRVLAGSQEQWDSALISMTGHSGGVRAVAFSPDGSRVASASDDNTVRLWEGKTGVHITTLEGHSESVYTVAFSSDGSRLASASYDGTVRMWDGKTGVHITTLEGHSGDVNAIAVSPHVSSSRLASASDGVRLWDGKTGVHITTLEGHSESVCAVAFSPDGSRLASASYDNTVRLWDGKTGVRITTLESHSGPVYAVAFSPDGSRLASASYDNTVRLWDGKMGAHITTLEGHSEMVNAVVFSPDGSRLVSVSYDKTVRMWDGKTGVHITALEGHFELVNAVTFSPDGSKLASASDDKTVRLWDGKTGAHITTLGGHSEPVNAVTFSSDGSRLASASYDNTVRLWDGKMGVHITALEGNSGLVHAVAFSPDGSKFASASDDKKVRLWDGKTGVHITTLEGHSGPVNAVTFSSDGSRLASASYDNTVRLWDGKTGAHIITLEGHSEMVNAVALSPDGSKLASASDDKKVRLWDGKTGVHITTLEGHSGPVNAVTFSSDGSRLASASYDNTVRLWDGKTGVHITSLEGHSEPVNAVTFSPDGSRLASASDDNTLRLWDCQHNSRLVFSEPYIDTIGSLAFLPDASSPPLSPMLSSEPSVADPGPNSSQAFVQSTYIMATVHRRDPSLSGLIMLRPLADGNYLTFPICWFPPHLNVCTTSLNPTGTSVAVGCEDGRMLLLDISGIPLP